MSKAENKVLTHFRVANVQVTIFERKTENGTFYDASPQRSYKDAQGKWHNTQSGYNLQGLLALEAAVRQTIDKFTALKEGEAHGEEVADEDAA